MKKISQQIIKQAAYISNRSKDPIFTPLVISALKTQVHSVLDYGDVLSLKAVTDEEVMSLLGSDMAILIELAYLHYSITAPGLIEYMRLNMDAYDLSTHAAKDAAVVDAVGCGVGLYYDILRAACRAYAKLACPENQMANAEKLITAVIKSRRHIAENTAMTE